MQLPDNVRAYLFKDFLEDDEVIEVICHKHPLILSKKFFKSIFFFILIPGFFFYIFPQIFWIFVLFLIVALAQMFQDIVTWYYDCWIITNMGVLDIDWATFFEKSVTRVEFHAIEGVSYEIKGFWGTILNFGNISVSKLGGSANILLEDGQNPKRIEKFILAHQDKYVTEKGFQDQVVLRQMLSDMMLSHIKKHGIPIDQKGLQEEEPIN